MSDPIERGLSAKALLDNPTFKDVMSEMATAYTETWKTAKTVEAREDLHRYVVLIEQLKADLQSMATTGDVLTAKRKRELEGGKRNIMRSIIP